MVSITTLHMTLIRVQPAEQTAIMLKHIMSHGLSWYTAYITVIFFMIACVLAFTVWFRQERMCNYAEVPNYPCTPPPTSNVPSFLTLLRC